MVHGCIYVVLSNVDPILMSQTKRTISPEEGTLVRVAYVLERWFLPMIICVFVGASCFAKINLSSSVQL